MILVTSESGEALHLCIDGMQIDTTMSLTSSMKQNLFNHRYIGIFEELHEFILLTGYIIFSCF